MQRIGKGRQEQTWRISAMILLALFFSMNVLPLLSAQGSDETSLPACCRKNGKHHCMMSMSERTQLAQRDPQFTAPIEKCPYSPASPVSLHGHGFRPTLGALAFAEIVSHPVQRPQTEARRRISFDRSRQKRGPPSVVLL